jgi:peptidoglycan-associated lipoprotein
MVCFEKLILTAAIAFALSACGTTVPLNDVPVIDKRVDNKDELRHTCCMNPDGPERDPLNDPAGILAKRSVYFDHDGYIVKEEFRPMLEAHTRYLLSRKTRSVSVVGHTDEHGSGEYNLALGQKRAEAVQRVLMLLGLPESQMESISYGEEKPKALGDDETARAENRRVDLEYR